MKSTGNLSSTNAIGIFDSGIGGLTVAQAITKELPNEKLIYFGDTVHLPWGDKSPDSIKYYAIRIAQFLLERNCKMIVIACNTASSLAYETVKDFVGNKALVVNVIDPVVKSITDKKKIKRVGIIGTKGTIKSNIYAHKIHKLNPKLHVASLATPLLASMIEEGFFDNKISRTVINSYLSRPKLNKIDSLILACTHYPLIKPEIAEYYKGKIDILDSAGIVAKNVRELLGKKNLLTTQKNPQHKFFVSDYTKSFETTAKFFFKKRIQLENAAIWK